MTSANFQPTNTEVLSASDTAFAAARFIKEIGRGIKGARSLERDDAAQLFAAMLTRRVSDVELGAILMALRIKGESSAEIAGFMDALEAHLPMLQVPVKSFAPIIIPSYNGARRLPNLTPLLAMLLAREGAPVLVHGIEHEVGRVTSAEIFSELGVLPVKNVNQIVTAFNAKNDMPVFAPISVLSPTLAALLQMRQILGVRNSSHTLAKIIQPFNQPVLRLVSYTHPEYVAMLSAYFADLAEANRGDVLLMRGTEGEAVANFKKVQQITWFHQNQATTLVESEFGTEATLPIDLDAVATAAWIKRVLAGQEQVPANIAQQVTHCLNCAGGLVGIEV